MNAQIKDQELYENIEFLADFQLFLGNIFRINGALLEISENICSEDSSITVPIWRVLAIIRSQPMTVSVIADYLGLKRQSVQATVNQMKKKNLIILKVNPNHKKSFLIALSAKGQEKIEEIYAYQKKVTEVFVKDLDLSSFELIKVTNFMNILRENSEKNSKII
ncbi:MAG: MarR family transcriptional regulator [Candidatus Poseidoniia archaeon]|nr:MarR family transcriptional regulator [Candidatus Poseidoniia archaeon]